MLRQRSRRPGMAFAAIFAALALIFTVAACGGSDDEGSSGNESSNGGGGTIGVSVPTVEGPFFTAMLYGINDEAEKLGYDVEIVDAGGYENVDQQVTQTENLIVQQVDAILIDPADPTVVEATVSDAMSQDIPVIGTGDPAPGSAADVSSSHCDIGKAMAEGTKELLPDGGDIAVLAGPAGASWSGDRLVCFKEEIDGTGINIVAEKTSDPAIEQGVTIATDFLQRYPDLNLIYGADDTVGVGAAQAVKASNLCGKTLILMAVLGRQAEDLMREDCVQYVVAQQTVEIGRIAVQTADKLIKGEELSETNIAVPLVPVTPENLDEVDLEKLREPDGYKP
jgi:ABC-type sugar transport system substrate-binding protein